MMLFQAACSAIAIFYRFSRPIAFLHNQDPQEKLARSKPTTTIVDHPLLGHIRAGGR